MLYSNLTKIWSFFVLGNVPSSKNGTSVMPLKRPKFTKTGKRLNHVQVKAKSVQTYTGNPAIQEQWQTAVAGLKLAIADSQVQSPYYLGFEFVRKTKQRCDYANLLQLPQDLLVKYGGVPDDSTDYLFPLLLPVQYSKEMPGLRLLLYKLLT